MKTSVSTSKAHRLLAQATFGPTDADINAVQVKGIKGWLDEQVAMPANPQHRARWLAADARAKAANPKLGATANHFIASWYKEAVTAPDQLRQRTAFALSQIFVVSTAVLKGPRSEAVASFHDMLLESAFGNVRDLLKKVALHPATGVYLSHRGNKPADPTTGRLPDQNFAREWMQLFSIGLVNPDGTPTYSQADVAGLADVLTGFSWAGPDTLKGRFWGGGSNPALSDPEKYHKPMQPYADFHSMAPKRVLGVDFPAGQSAMQDLDMAADLLFNHPACGPFLCRQLIQRLVTSNPPLPYLMRVVKVFEDNGQGVRGDLGAVVKAILNDSHARQPWYMDGRYGKLREPVLRLTAYLRALGATSASGEWLMSPTDGSDTLRQTPGGAPSVFNFFAPGYTLPGGDLTLAGMVAPELQITDTASVAGYANWMFGTIQRGCGARGIDGKAAQPDIQVDIQALKDIATDPAALVAAVVAKFFPDTPPETYTAPIVAAVTAQTMPPKTWFGGGQAQENAKLRRVWTALACVLVSPQWLVQN